MEVFPKFIIEGDNLIIQKCTFHKQIVIDPLKVKGGGWYRFIREDNTFIFYGESSDFGKATLDDIKLCVENGKVFSGNNLRKCFSGKYNFAYDIGSEIIQL